jgi:tetratricopeptide (TPR) repeat protein
MGVLADWAAQKPDHILRGVFHYHEANLPTALELAEALAMHEHIGALLQALGAHAHAQRNFPEAARYYTRLAEHWEQTRGEGKHLAGVYHQLGMIAEEQRDFPTAEAWYQKALAIKEKQGDEHRAAQSYAVLGLLAGQQDEWVEAARWLIKSIRGFMRTNDERSTQAVLWALLHCYQRAPNNDKQAILVLWKQAGLGPFPEIPGG